MQLLEDTVQLLEDTARVDPSSDAEVARSGRLVTYLGIAPGVGKTYEMFRDGRAARRRGIDTVVAYWERHRRPDTASALGPLELLSPHLVEHGDSLFTELDVKGVLKRRRQIALVDELAHSVVGGAPHQKRWHDVRVLLEAGISVATTLKVANIESLGHAVAQITGAPVAESVPDALILSGNVVFVELPPSALHDRLSRGHILPADRIDVALSGYFRFANLAELEELANGWLFDEIPHHPMAVVPGGVPRPAPVTVIVGLAGAQGDVWLIRFAAELAELSNAKLEGVHVRALDNLEPRDLGQADRNRRLLEQLHATYREVKAIDPVTGLLRAASPAPHAEFVVGTCRRSRRRLASRTGTTAVLLRGARGVPVHVVNVGWQKRRLDGPAALRARQP